MKALRVGTRGSRLALWQAEHVAARLRRLEGAPPVEIVEIRTEGDRIVDVPLSALPGKAFFTKEIEQALLEQRVDLAVHSLKDLATAMPPGLALGAVLEREDPRDVLLVRSDLAAGGVTGLDDLPAGARVGTSSLRRRALLARWRPDTQGAGLEILDLRGNVPTRLDRLEAGDYEAIVLAAAGVLRLGLDSHVSSYLPPERFPPAVSQGAVAVQVREPGSPSDAEVLRWTAALEHGPTRLATTAERALLRRLEGGCQVPVGALARFARPGELELFALVASLDGRSAVEGRRRGAVEGMEAAAALGLALAEDLLERGAGEILEAIRREMPRRSS